MAAQSSQSISDASMTDLNLAPDAVGIAPADVPAELAGLRICESPERALAYWQKTPPHLPPPPPILEFPPERPRPPAQSYRAASQPVVFPGKLRQDLQSLCEREGVSQFVLLLAAFQTLLTRYTRQDDIVVGSSIAGREAVSGNAVAIRVDLSGAPSF